MIVKKMQSLLIKMKTAFRVSSAKIEKHLDEDSIVHHAQKDMLEMGRFAKKKVSSLRIDFL